MPKQTTYHKTYDSARAKYLAMKEKGFPVVLKRPINGHKLYRVKVL